MANDARVDILLALKAQLTGFDGSAAAINRLKSDVTNAARAMDTETDKLAAKLKKKFSASNIGMSILGGFGLGSGFAAINTGLTAVTSAIENHRRQVEALEQAWKDALTRSREYQLALLSPDKQIAGLEAWLREKQQEYVQLVKVRDYLFTMGNPATGEMSATTISQPDATPANLEKISKNLAEQENLIKRIGELRGDIAKDEKKSAQDAKARAKEISAAAAEAAKEQEQAREKIAGALAEQDRQLATLAERYRQLIDPAREYAQQQEEINMLLRGGKLSADEAAAALAAVATAAAAAEEARVEAALKQFFGPLDEASDEAFRKLAADARAYDREMAQLWNNVSDRAGQAFADVLLDGTNAFRSLAREISRAVIEITARLAIINPILNAVFGGFGGFEKLPTFFSKATAAGGGTFLTRGPTNFTVGDNPGGVELVSVLPLSGVGRSSLNGRSLAMAGGGTALAGLGGDTFNFNYSFTGGVTAGELARMLPQLQASAKAGVLEATRRRRDGFR